ncbi:MAG: 3,4-dehydroadipyl-CoA semialdehyde dehydrogenase [Planctomycetota bacterium]|nr:3,4-dehydroadipyl-CoA semialdehyde dehydrogenase [Planctomycetota bacterium]
MQALSSYVLGRWIQGTDKPVTLENPTTEAALATVGSGGFDAKSVLAFGRDKGGPALRKLTFAERGKLLAGLSAAIHEKRDELIQLALENGGNTRGDAKFDIDGATGTLMFYAGLAEKLGTRPFLVDGDGMQLGRTARFWGQHVYVTRPGVAVHVNAFNFPAWGMMEKIACSFLAGMPVIEKPGTPTALVAWRIAQIVVEKGLLPEGAYQFVCGSLGDMLDHMGAQDVLAFTGSSATGAKLRGNANLVRHNVRVNIEADSLNAAVLAPDVDASAETYGLFLSNVALDMTQKTGQKCTAVRRVLVPAERVKDVVTDLVAQLSRTKVGDPSDKDVRMGPLASRSQFEDVTKGIERLAKHGTVATGGAQRSSAKGFFVAPTVIVARDARDPAFHAEEVFGPCTVVLPYSGDALEAAQIVNLGGGGLVCSVYGNDSSWTDRFVLEAAPWHGRIWIGSDKSAEQALPPGMVLPMMIHGGPGRAGGGDELGAERGLHFYMQRTALQGFKGALEASFGNAPSAAKESTATKA